MANEKLKKTLAEFEADNRLPHAVIIEGGDADTRAEFADDLAAWAVCSGEKKPCGECKNCVNAAAHSHSDIYFAKGAGKTDIYNKDEVEHIIRDASIKPNQAQRKVYIFAECDKRLPPISQNALLKTLEEPVQDVLFIITCENSKSMLETVRSRCVTLTLEDTGEVDEKALESARKIVLGIIAPNEMPLMKALYELTDRFAAIDALGVTVRLLRDGLVLYCGGAPELDSETADRLCSSLSKSAFLRLIEITQDAQIKINNNVGLKLIGAWLCGEYRRTLWQR